MRGKKQLEVLAKETMESLGHLSTDLLNTCLSSCDNFRRGKHAEASVEVVKIVDASQWLVEGLLELRRTLKFLNILSANWQESESKLKDDTAKLLSAFEKKDYVLAADVLEYELCETLEAWLHILIETARNFEQEQTTLASYGEMEPGTLD